MHLWPLIFGPHAHEISLSFRIQQADWLPSCSAARLVMVCFINSFFAASAAKREDAVKTFVNLNGFR